MPQRLRRIAAEIARRHRDRAQAEHVGSRIVAVVVHQAFERRRAQQRLRLRGQPVVAAPTPLAARVDARQASARSGRRRRGQLVVTLPPVRRQRDHHARIGRRHAVGDQRRQAGDVTCVESERPADDARHHAERVVCKRGDPAREQRRTGGHGAERRAARDGFKRQRQRVAPAPARQRHDPRCVESLGRQIGQQRDDFAGRLRAVPFDAPKRARHAAFADHPDGLFAHAPSPNPPPSCQSPSGRHAAARPYSRSTNAPPRPAGKERVRIERPSTIHSSPGRTVSSSAPTKARSCVRPRSQGSRSTIIPSSGS